MSAILSGVAYVYELFIKFKDSTAYKLTITPQVCYLEKALNDRYDIADRRIFITDGISYDPLPLYLKVENKPVVLYTKEEDKVAVLFTKSETGLFSVDFIVNVPAAVAFAEAEMRAIVDVYKLAGKIYSIQIF